MLFLATVFLKDHKLGVLLAGSYQNLFTGSNSMFFEPSSQPNPDPPTGQPKYNIYENYSGNYSHLILYMFVNIIRNKHDTLHMQSLITK